MKLMNWSSAALLSLTGLAVTHSNNASALTYEETACIAQMFMEGNDPTGCFNTGGDAGSAGSGGSGSGSGSSGGSSGPGGGSSTWRTCVTPTFWFTGPVDPATVTSSFVFVPRPFGTSYDITDYKTSFTQSVGGKQYRFDKVTRETIQPYNGGPYLASEQYTWTVTPVGASGSSNSKTCTDVNP